MKKLLLSVILMILFSAFAVSALAEHSVFPAEGDLDETQALDIVVTQICALLNCEEEDIRGHWYYRAVYEPEAGLGESRHDARWNVVANPVDPDDQYMYVRLTIHAAGGAVTDRYAETECLWPGCPDQPQEVLPLIPRKDQMQPAEAVQKAVDLLAEAFETWKPAPWPEDEITRWSNYELNGSSDGSGRFWYHVRFGDLSGAYSVYTWHVWLDANTGEVVWQSDPARFAARCLFMHTGIDYGTHCRQVTEQCEAVWGKQNGWNYHQYAEWEALCFGHPYWPELRYGLPGEGECGYEEARAAAIAWVQEQEETPGVWVAVSSIFHVDSGNQRHERLAQGITEEEHLWEIWLKRLGAPDGERVKVWLDPRTCEVVDGPRG